VRCADGAVAGSLDRRLLGDIVFHGGVKTKVSKWTRGARLDTCVALFRPRSPCT
jgi:hypothetical protein